MSDKDQILLNNQEISNIISDFRNTNSSISFKTDMAEALTAKGVETSASDSFDTLVENVGRIETLDIGTADATASASQIIEGESAYVKGEKITGTMVSVGERTFTPSAEEQKITGGVYLSGDQTIAGDSNLVAANIKKDTSIFGVTGTYDPVTTALGFSTSAVYNLSASMSNVVKKFSSPIKVVMVETNPGSGFCWIVWFPGSGSNFTLQFSMTSTQSSATKPTIMSVNSTNTSLLSANKTSMTWNNVNSYSTGSKYNGTCTISSDMLSATISTGSSGDFSANQIVFIA